MKEHFDNFHCSEMRTYENILRIFICYELKIHRNMPKGCVENIVRTFLEHPDLRIYKV